VDNGMRRNDVIRVAVVSVDHWRLSGGPQARPNIYLIIR